jgi:dienelactone hydrolase
MRIIVVLFAASLALGADTRNTYTPNTDTHFTFNAPTDLKTWEARRTQLRASILFNAGLMPMPVKTALNPIVAGRIEHPDYAIERIALETLPGYWLGGNLYLPKGRLGRAPAILHPHGHWTYGRLESQPLCSPQSFGINLARQGFAVFAYDMVGYNDTAQTPHDFSTPEYQLWNFTPLGLQLWNSIRVVDFLAARPDIDAGKIGISGASGGGTQTFLLAAVDDRIGAAAPVNMVSGIMQGGCICENAPGLRIGTNNIETAALFAPKPQLLVAATGDWTKNVPKEELPAVRGVYQLYGRPELIDAVQFDSPHNYHQQSREAVYEFFRKTFTPDAAPFKERGATIEKLQDMLVWQGRALPAHAKDFRDVFEEWKAISREQAEAAKPAEIRQRLALALGITGATEVEAKGAMLVHQGGNAETPYRFIAGKSPAVLLLDPGGIAEAEKSGEYAKLKAEGRAMLLIDAFQTGSAVAARDRSHKHFLTFNRSDDAARVADALAALAWLSMKQPGAIEISAAGKARCWALLAAAVGDAPARLLFDSATLITSEQDLVRDCFIPGLLRAGGLEAARRAMSR